MLRGKIAKCFRVVGKIIKALDSSYKQKLIANLWQHGQIYSVYTRLAVCAV